MWGTHIVSQSSASKAWKKAFFALPLTVSCLGAHAPSATGRSMLSERRRRRKSNLAGTHETRGGVEPPASAASMRKSRTAWPGTMIVPSLKLTKIKSSRKHGPDGEEDDDDANLPSSQIPAPLRCLTNLPPRGRGNGPPAEKKEREPTPLWTRMVLRCVTADSRVQRQHGGALCLKLFFALMSPYWRTTIRIAPGTSLRCSCPLPVRVGVVLPINHLCSTVGPEGVLHD